MTSENSMLVNSGNVYQLIQGVIIGRDVNVLHNTLTSNNKTIKTTAIATTYATMSGVIEKAIISGQVADIHSIIQYMMCNPIALDRRINAPNRQQGLGLPSLLASLGKHIKYLGQGNKRGSRSYYHRYTTAFGSNTSELAKFEKITAIFNGYYSDYYQQAAKLAISKLKQAIGSLENTKSSDFSDLKVYSTAYAHKKIMQGVDFAGDLNHEKPIKRSVKRHDKKVEVNQVLEAKKAKTTIIRRKKVDTKQALAAKQAKIAIRRKKAEVKRALTVPEAEKVESKQVVKPERVAQPALLLTNQIVTPNRVLQPAGFVGKKLAKKAKRQKRQLSWCKNL